MNFNDFASRDVRGINFWMQSGIVLWFKWTPKYNITLPIISAF